MSGVYRLDVTHKPQNAPTFPVWEADAFRISDGAYMGTGNGDTPGEAINKARRALMQRAQASEPFSVELDEQGRIVSRDHRTGGRDDSPDVTPERPYADVGGAS